MRSPTEAFAGTGTPAHPAQTVSPGGFMPDLPASVRPSCVFHLSVSSQRPQRWCPLEVTVSRLRPHSFSCCCCSWAKQQPVGSSLHLPPPPSTASPDHLCALESPHPTPNIHRNAGHPIEMQNPTGLAGSSADVLGPGRGRRWKRRFPLYGRGATTYQKTRIHNLLFQKILFTWTHYPSPPVASGRPGSPSHQVGAEDSPESKGAVS